MLTGKCSWTDILKMKAFCSPKVLVNRVPFAAAYPKKLNLQSKFLYTLIKIYYVLTSIGTWWA